MALAPDREGPCPRSLIARQFFVFSTLHELGLDASLLDVEEDRLVDGSTRAERTHKTSHDVGKAGELAKRIDRADWDCLIRAERNMLRMTRAELHGLVWSKPMTEIARLYGIRDQHVAQACDAHDIARPGAGHWQRVEHGKSTETFALDNKNYSPEAVIIIEPAVGKPGRG